jgi:hypothetical protein
VEAVSKAINRKFLLIILTEGTKMDKAIIALLISVSLFLLICSRSGYALDSDDDGIPDLQDNCPFAYNPGQEDSDAYPVTPTCMDGICEGDENGCNCPQDCGPTYCLDYVPVCGNGQCELIASPGESHENCPQDCPQPTATDGYGDACDNCPFIINPGQSDRDRDRVGNYCDNCPDTYNPSQTDSDSDGAGNPCDADCPNLDRFNPVDLFDFSILGADWYVADVNLPGDLNLDDVVDMNDLALFSAYWLSDCYE